MAPPSMDQPGQAVGGGEPASAAVGSNAGLVRTPVGNLGTLADALAFATGAGAWVVGDQRVRIYGVPTISATATGTRVVPTPAGTAPVTVVGGSGSVRSS